MVGVKQDKMGYVSIAFNMFIPGTEFSGDLASTTFERIDQIVEWADFRHNK
jgi:hypothetical protein